MLIDLKPEQMTYEERLEAILALAGKDIGVMLNMRLAREGFMIRIHRRNKGYPGRVESCEFVDLTPGRDIVFGDPPESVPSRA